MATDFSQQRQVAVFVLLQLLELLGLVASAFSSRCWESQQQLSRAQFLVSLGVEKPQPQLRERWCPRCLQPFSLSWFGAEAAL